MHFSPHLSPVRVSKTRPRVLGRQAQYELATSRSDVSRQISQLYFEEGQYMLRDLGSTNGTKLNSKQVSVLSPGDKSEMGSRFRTRRPKPLGRMSSDGSGHALGSIEIKSKLMLGLGVD